MRRISSKLAVMLVTSGNKASAAWCDDWRHKVLMHRPPLTVVEANPFVAHACVGAHCRAALAGATGAVEVLLSHGANPHALGGFAVQAAHIRSHAAVLRVLEAHGVSATVA